MGREVSKTRIAAPSLGMGRNAGNSVLMWQGSVGLLDKRLPWVRLWVREGVHVGDFKFRYLGLVGLEKKMFILIF